MDKTTMQLAVEGLDVGKRDAFPADDQNSSPVERTAKMLAGSSLEEGALPRENEGQPDAEAIDGADAQLDAGAESAVTVEEPRVSREVKTPEDYWRLVEAERASRMNNLDASEDDNDDSEPDDEKAPEDKVKPDSRWMDKLDRDKNGKLCQTLKNAELIFSHDPKLVGLVGLNSFSEKIEIRKMPPWERPSLNDDNDTTKDKTAKDKPDPLRMPDVPEPEWRNSDASELYAYLSRTYKFEKQSLINDCVLMFARRKRFHPVRDYLRQLKWDGTPRVRTLIHDYYGVPDSEYLHKVMVKTLLGAVTRVWRPGCQFDTVLTFYGPQGRGKSMFWANLAGRWFNDLVVSFSGRDAMHGLEGAWVTELAEMAALSNTGVEKNKAMISRKNDRFRKAYEKLVEDHPRQGIFVATTNSSDFLKDFTGNRRFWPVDVTPYEPPAKSIHDDLPSEADQIWAEVQVIYDMGEETVYADQDMIEELEQRQKNFAAYNPVQDAIEEYLKRMLPEDWKNMSIEQHIEWLKDEDEIGTVKRTQVCVQEVVREALNGVVKDSGKKLWDQVSDIISNIGYSDGTHWHRPRRQTRVPGYGKQRIFELL